MAKLSLKDLSLSGKKVLMRADFNVPLSDGKITDDMRMQKALPSIKYILENNASLILMSHLGRPKGKKDQKLSLAPIAKRLSKLLKTNVTMAPNCIGADVNNLVKDLKPKEILLLENLRFYAAEEHPDNDPDFAKKLSKLADIYVNDAFGTAHRKHSSTYSITKYFPKTSVAGFLLEKEIEYLGNFLMSPKRPFFAIIGGAKISTKAQVILNLLDKVDALFIGGGMSYTFLKAQNISIGTSLYEDSQLQTAKEILKKAKKNGITIHFPPDLIIAKDFSNDAEFTTVFTEDGIPDNYQGMDIGPKTRKQWSLLLQNAQTILWNGPLGVFEFPNFADGTNAIAKTLADSSAITIIGGGDSVSAIHKLGIEDRFSHLSTGGGASLEYIEFGTLPAIEALTEKE